MRPDTIAVFGHSSGRCRLCLIKGIGHIALITANCLIQKPLAYRHHSFEYGIFPALAYADAASEQYRLG